MTGLNISVLHVYFMRGTEKILMGRLALKDRKIFFEYSSEFLKTGLELSPFKLPLKSGVIVCEDHLFDGLFGVFNDSLPDGWGRLLLDRKLMKMSLNPGDLSPLDRLQYVGSHGMGALVYEPEIAGIGFASHEDLDEISHEVLQFQENQGDQFVEDLLDMNGSSAGARPKILKTLEGENWIIKFRSSLDPLDMGPIEYAYHLMAHEAGLEVPFAQIFPSKKGPGYFGVKRFDRTQQQSRHMHTMSGLLHSDHRIPNLDYETILRATLWLTKDVREYEKQFRVAIFNALSHNRDDHAKNFSFLMDEKGVWKVSPSYDLTFSSGPSGEHCTTIMGEGKNPSLSHFLKLAEIGGLKKKNALQIIDEVNHAVSQWKIHAQNAGVQPASLKRIQNSLNQTLKI
ncbi:MAG: type II toxin-antitoxin system HipA family toxin [Alphaproteobacteria bacterium]